MVLSCSVQYQECMDANNEKCKSSAVRFYYSLGSFDFIVLFFTKVFKLCEVDFFFKNLGWFMLRVPCGE